MTIIYYLLKMVMFILYYLYSNIKFITFIINAYEHRKISEQLDHFYDNSFKDFCVELKK